MITWGSSGSHQPSLISSSSKPVEDTSSLTRATFSVSILREIASYYFQNQRQQVLLNSKDSNWLSVLVVSGRTALATRRSPAQGSDNFSVWKSAPWHLLLLPAGPALGQSCYVAQAKQRVQLPVRLLSLTTPPHTDCKAWFEVGVPAVQLEISPMPRKTKSI